MNIQAKLAICIAAGALIAACGSEHPLPEDQQWATRTAAVGTGQVLGVGSFSTCIVDSQQHLQCWGHDPNIGGVMTAPPGLTGVKEVAVGNSHVVALKNDGTLVTWGEGAYGEKAPPIPAGLTNIISVSAGMFSSCTLSDAGDVRCWGPMAKTSTFSYPGAVKVTGGVTTGCVLMADRSVKCWVGMIPPANADVTSLEAEDGVDFACASKVDGSVACRGYLPPAGLTDVAQVVIGSNHACARRSNGEIVCWGINNYGQMTPPVGLGPVKLLSAGPNRTCAITESNEVVCWGKNTYGANNIPPGLIPYGSDPCVPSPCTAGESCFAKNPDEAKCCPSGYEWTDAYGDSCVNRLDYEPTENDYAVVGGGRVTIKDCPLFGADPGCKITLEREIPSRGGKPTLLLGGFRILDMTGDGRTSRLAVRVTPLIQDKVGYQEGHHQFEVAVKFGSPVLAGPAYATVEIEYWIVEAGGALDFRTQDMTCSGTSSCNDSQTVTIADRKGWEHFGIAIQEFSIDLKNTGITKTLAVNPSMMYEGPIVSCPRSPDWGTPCPWECEPGQDPGCFLAPSWYGSFNVCPASPDFDTPCPWDCTPWVDDGCFENWTGTEYIAVCPASMDASSPCPWSCEPGTNAGCVDEFPVCLRTASVDEPCPWNCDPGNDPGCIHMLGANGEYVSCPASQNSDIPCPWDCIPGQDAGCLDARNDLGEDYVTCPASTSSGQACPWDCSGERGCTTSGLADQTFDMTCNALVGPASASIIDECSARLVVFRAASSGVEYAAQCYDPIALATCPDPADCSACPESQYCAPPGTRACLPGHGGLVLTPYGTWIYGEMRPAANYMYDTSWRASLSGSVWSSTKQFGGGIAPIGYFLGLQGFSFKDMQSGFASKHTEVRAGCFAQASTMSSTKNFNLNYTVEAILKDPAGRGVNRSVDCLNWWQM